MCVETLMEVVVVVDAEAGSLVVEMVEMAVRTPVNENVKVEVPASEQE